MATKKKTKKKAASSEKQLLIDETVATIAAKEMKKARAWVGIVYPDSAPKNWRDLIDDLHVQWAHSPLHDQDVNVAAEGGPELKKPHYHVLVYWDGPTTYNVAAALFKKTLNSVSPQKCESVRGAVRYFVHMDNPEKVQYSVSDIRSFGGFDIDSMLKPGESFYSECLAQITDYILDNNVVEFSHLVAHSRATNHAWWECCMLRYTNAIKTLIASNRNAYALKEHMNKLVEEQKKLNKQEEQEND